MNRPRGSEEPKITASHLPRPNGWMGPAIILVAAVIAVGPLLLYGPSCTGDAGFHFISWIDAERSMSNGLLYPHWASSPNFGAGEPRFVFYPPLTWMGAAVLGMLLPWGSVQILLFILLLAATGMATRALAREALADGPATLAGCASIFLGYALFNIYRRCDPAEMMGGFWIPLLLLFALRRRNPAGNFQQRTFDGSAAPLAIVMAGVWLSNGPVGIMASYLLAAVALASTLIEKSLAPMVRATVSIIVGMGLASPYLIPAVWESKWISIIKYAVAFRYFAVENSWLFGIHSDPNMFPHDRMLHLVSIVAVAMLAIAFGGSAIAWMRGVVPGERKWWLPLALIPPAVLFLLLPISEPVWNLLPELRLLQFPWRWLVVLEAPMGICFALAVWSDRRTARIPLLAACAAVFFAIGIAAPHWWFVECGTFIASAEESVREGIGVLGKPEYAPPGIRVPLVFPLVDAKGNPLLDALDDPQVHPLVQDLPSACLLDAHPQASVQGDAGSAPAWHGESASCKRAGWQELTFIDDLSHPDVVRFVPERKWIVGVAEHAGYLILRLRYYPAWGVKVNGSPVTAVAEQERGLMAVPVPQGDVQVSIDWTTTGDVVAGRLVSGVALLLVIGLYLLERKLSPPHLQTATAGSYGSGEEPKLSKTEPMQPISSSPMRTDRRNTPSDKPPKSAGQKRPRKPEIGGGSR